MARQAITPGGALLRSSRMFSLPKPLTHSSSKHARQDDLRSNTMTQPIPQYQAIASPYTSREKGDWGLKRQMPLKYTLAVSSPSLRIHQIDTRESVTDYASAADHVVSLEKFQQLGVCMAPQPPHANSITAISYSPALANKSVFEESTDVTAVTKHTRKLYCQRWKFRGPNVGAMTYGQLLQYIRKQVQPRRAAFNELIRKKKAEQMTSVQRQEAISKGEKPPPPVRAREIKDQELTEYICLLRNDRLTLFDLVADFLDLVPLPPPAHIIDALKKSSLKSQYKSAGQPASHPSAGISYLRTSSCMDNHPLYGPQEYPEPVLARVLRPRFQTMLPRLGIGGFVTTVPSGNNEFNRRHDLKKVAPPKGVSYLDLETPGGAKTYIQAKRAHVDPLGRVVLEAGLTSAEAKLIALERKGLKTVYNNDPLIPVLHASNNQKSDDSDHLEPVDQEINSSVEGMNVDPETDIMSSSEAYGLGRPENLDS
ncbi:hypothetical protein CDD81_2570 [Ophiocordyceps australis]|uniref:Uncharacterized protein n=1 Tax=Ophiocordyceps australis TaxID=1399860 RepID=A0A2C5XWP9_9HYPO|nr:hypothetical protein CDD81_2570 [Ophiocordyceps australis]